MNANEIQFVDVSAQEYIHILHRVVLHLQGDPILNALSMDTLYLLAAPLATKLTEALN
jgi:hypothetical protein